MKKLLVGLLLLLPSLAFGYQGVTGVWAMKKGDFTTRNFAGTRVGIQDAVNYCPYGGIIQVYVGRIVNDGTPIRIPYSGITFMGSGDSTVFAGNTTATDTTNIFEITGSRVTLKDFKIDGTKYARTGNKGYGIALFGSSCNISNVLVTNTPNNGIYVSDSTCVNTRITNCRFTDNGLSTGATASVYSNGEGTQVSNSIFSINAGIVLNGKYSIASGNSIEGMYPTVLSIANGIFLKAKGCSAVGNNIRTIFNGVEFTADSCLITSNTLTRNRNGIHSPSYGAGVTISNNTIYNPFYFGVFIEAGITSNDISIIGNTIIGTGVFLIDMECYGVAPICKNITVANNYVSVASPMSGGVPVRLSSLSGGKYQNLVVSNNTLVGGNSYSLQFGTSGDSRFDSTTVTNNSFLSYKTAPISFGNPTYASRIYMSNNFCRSYIGRSEIPALPSNWIVDSVGTNAIRGSKGVFEDSLRVGISNKPSNLVVSGDAYVYGTLTAGTLNYSYSDTTDLVLSHSLSVGDSLNINKTSALVGGFGSSGDSWVSKKFTVGDSLRVLGPAIFDTGTKSTGDSWTAGNYDVGGKATVKDSLRVGSYLDLVGDAYLQNNRFLYWRDATSLLRPIVKVDSINNVVIYPAGNNIDFMSNAGTLNTRIYGVGDGISVPTLQIGGYTYLSNATNNRHIHQKSTATGAGIAIRDSINAIDLDFFNKDGSIWAKGSIIAKDSLNTSGVFTAETKAVITDSLRVNKGIRTAGSIDIDGPGDMLRFNTATTPSIYTTNPVTPLSLGAMGDSQVVAISSSALYTKTKLWSADSLIAKNANIQGNLNITGYTGYPTTLKLSSPGASILEDSTSIHLNTGITSSVSYFPRIVISKNGTEQLVLASGGINGGLYFKPGNYLRFGLIPSMSVSNYSSTKATLTEDGNFRVGDTGVPTANLEVARNATVNDSLRVNKGIYIGGQFINKVLRGSAALDFDLTSVVYQDITFTLNGVSTDDDVLLTPPNAVIGEAIAYNAYCSATNSVTVRAFRLSGTPNPPLGTFKVVVIK